MTDKRAKDLLRDHFHLLTGAHKEVRDAIRHAFWAIEDRAAILHAYEVDGWSTKVADAARRHMRGES